MNSQTRHPTTEQWDRLRAGLLDDNPGERDALQAHLSQCPECQQHWRQIDQVATLAMPDSAQALGNIRRQALHASPGARHSHWLPALAAAVTLAIGIGWWWQPGTTPQNSEMVAQQGDIPDLYEDLDFYLWLAEEGAETEHETPNHT